MDEKAQKILTALKGRTNINNTNNDNNDNNLTTSIIVPNESDVEEIATSSSRLAEPVKEALASQGTLPPNWHGVKLDLFLNGQNDQGKDQLTLRMSIMTSPTNTVQVNAALNSPTRHTYRGASKNGDPEHWKAVRLYEAGLKRDNISYRSSKFVLTNKKGSLENLVCFVYKISGAWTTTIIREGKSYEFDIDQDGSQGFRKKNGIATAYYGVGKSNAKWISLKELGI